MHRPHGLQGSLKRRYKHPSLLPSMGTTRQKSSCRNGLQNGPRLLSRVKAGTHSPSPTGSHTAAYTPKQGPSGQGRYHYPRRIPHVHEHPRAGCQNGKLCRFWVLAGGALPKNAESLRSSDALMRVAAPRRRGPAGLRNLFRFCRNRDLYIRRSWFSACARWGWYYYPRRALRAAETLDGRLSKRLTCRFLRSGGRSSPHNSYFLANTQNFLLAVPVANAFALWYDKFDKSEFIVLFHSYQNSFLMLFLLRE